MKIQDYLKRPAVAALLGAVIGLIVGLIWAWMIQPVTWTNVAPSQLGTSYQEQYLRMAIDSYRVDPNDALATARFQAMGTTGSSMLDYIQKNPAGQDVNAIANFMTVVEPGGAVATPATSGGRTTVSRRSTRSRRHADPPPNASRANRAESLATVR
jgi:hypothetical protein